MSLNIKEAKNSALGELDIMIDSANKQTFDKVIAGNYFLQFDNSVHAISWHGYYKISAENTIQIPTIHFKTSYKDVKHTGTINVNEPIAFPICSLYIPSELSWLEEINVSDYPASSKKLKYNFKDILGTENQRLDIFITPKMLSAQKILEGNLAFAYKFADVQLYNSAEGLLVPLKEIQDNPELDQDSLINVYSLGNGYDVIIRTVGNQNSKFSELEGIYSLLVHDPNDALNRMANRFYVHVDGDSIVQQGIIKDEL